MARSSAGVSALSRSLAILDAFAVEAPFLTLTQIAHRAGLPLTSAHTRVAELAELGLLERMPDRSYRLGNRLWEIGSRTPGALGLREVAQPYLQELHARVRQHVQVCVRLGLDALVIERLSTREAVINATIVGARIALQHSSSGLVLLAYAERELLRNVIRSGLAPVTDAGFQNEEQLRAAVHHARRDGYAVAAGFIHPGSRGISVPIRGSENAVVGALSVVIANDGTPANQYVELLQATAVRITDTLLRSYLPPEHPRALPGGKYRPMVNSSEPSMNYLQYLTSS